jgi:hypothetical protein
MWKMKGLGLKGGWPYSLVPPQKLGNSSCWPHRQGRHFWATTQCQGAAQKVFPFLLLYLCLFPSTGVNCLWKEKKIKIFQIYVTLKKQSLSLIPYTSA